MMRGDPRGLLLHQPMSRKRTQQKNRTLPNGAMKILLMRQPVRTMHIPQMCIAVVQVRSSADEEDLSNTGDEGRFIEATAVSMESQGESAVEEPSTMHPTPAESSNEAPGPSGTQSANESKSMWQRLRGIGRQQNKVRLISQSSMTTDDI